MHLIFTESSRNEYSEGIECLKKAWTLVGSKLKTHGKDIWIKNLMYHIIGSYSYAHAYVHSYPSEVPKILEDNVCSFLLMHGA